MTQQLQQPNVGILEVCKPRPCSFGKNIIWGHAHSCLVAADCALAYCFSCKLGVSSLSKVSSVNAFVQDPAVNLTQLCRCQLKQVKPLQHFQRASSDDCPSGVQCCTCRRGWHYVAAYLGHGAAERAKQCAVWSMGLGCTSTRDEALATASVVLRTSASMLFMLSDCL